MRYVLALIVAMLCSAKACAGLALDFSNNVDPTNATHSQLGDYIAGAFTTFEEVAPGVDARVTGGIIGSGHTYDGLFPDYQSDNLGLLYTGTQNGTLGGIQITIDFFQSDGIVDGNTQLITPRLMGDFELTFHDIDGEASQTEYLQAFLADGLYSYQVSNVDPLSVANNNVVYQFRGNGVNLNEADASGATILRYINTTGVTVNLFAQTTSNAPNGVFQAIDGDGDTHNPSDFAAAVIVATPEPSAAILTMLVGFGLAGTRRKRIAKRKSPVCV